MILHGRRPERLQQVAAEIIAETGTRPDTVLSDLSSLEQVRGLATQVGELTDSLQILINNAGWNRRAGRPTSQPSADGYELRLAVNYLAPFESRVHMRPRTTSVCRTASGT